jgi:hypothetical protein
VALELALVALVALPFLVPASDRETAGPFGVVALLLLPLPVLAWVLPFAIHQLHTVRVSDGLLTARTLRGERSLEVTRIRKVWVQGVASRGAEIELLGLTTDRGEHLWLSWSDSSMDPKCALLRPLVRDIAARRGVSVSPRARALLDLPGSPSGGHLAAVWLFSAVMYLIGIVLMVVCAVLYLQRAYTG